MQLNRAFDPFRLPVAWLKEAKTLMCEKRATRDQIAEVLAEKVDALQAYHEMDKNARIVAIRIRLAIADPEDPQHAGWSKFLGYWRHRKSKAKQRARRKADPAYNEEIMQKRRDQRASLVAKRKGLRDYERERAKERKEWLKQNDPEEWERQQKVRQASNRANYERNREKYKARAKANEERIKAQDPEEWRRRVKRRQGQQYAWWRRNRHELNRQKRIKRNRDKQIGETKR